MLPKMAEALGKVCFEENLIKFVIFIVLCVLCPKVGYFLDRPRARGSRYIPIFLNCTISTPLNMKRCSK